MVDPAEFFGTRAIQDPYPLYDRLRAAGPVHRVGDSGFYLVCNRDAITEVVSRPADFSSNLTATMTYTADGGVAAFPMDKVGGRTHILVTADDPVHAAHRKLLLSQFTAKRVRAFEPLIAEIFEKLWATGIVDGRIEWMDAVANRLPMMVVARLIGVPTAHWTGRAPDGVVEDFHAVQLLYRAEVLPGEPRVVEVGGSTVEAAWFTVEELLGLPITYVVRSGIEALGG